MRIPKNILLHELIGLSCEVIESSNKNHIGVNGKITDETMKTLVIDGKRVFKKGSTFRLSLEKEKVDVEGDYLVARPEDRIKKKVKRW